MGNLKRIASREGNVIAANNMVRRAKARNRILSSDDESEGEGNEVTENDEEGGAGQKTDEHDMSKQKVSGSDS